MTTLATMLLALAVQAPSQDGQTQIPFTILAEGNIFIQTDPLQKVFTTSKEFEELWKKLFGIKPVKALPAIDFDKEAVVVISVGQRPHAGYGVTVTSIVKRGEELQIVFKEKLPDPEKSYAQVLSYPYVMMRMPKPDRKVVFTK